MNFVECRTCLGRFGNNDIVSVQTKIVEQKSILQAIEEIASIEVSETDVLPNQICLNCFKLLESSLAFRKQIILSHFELKKRQQSEVRDPLLTESEEQCVKSNINSKLTNKAGEVEKINDTKESLNVYVKEEKVLLGPTLNHISTESKGYNNIEKNCDKESVRSKTPDFDDSGSDWNEANDNESSAGSFSDTQKVKKLSPTTKNGKKARVIHRSRRKPATNVLHSEDSDSDVPLEKLREEIKNLENKNEPKERKRKEKKGCTEGARLCPICGKLFKARTNFNTHMSTVHRKKPDKPNKVYFSLCPDCGRVITGTRQNFVAHIKYHHSDKAQVKQRFACDVCPRKFYREKNLIIHQRIHKGEKGYVCELCPDKSYTQIGGLILHRRKVHLKKPTCTCNYCGKQFYEKHYLETHIRQWHTGERPFSCEICGKAFSCNGTLLRHRKDSHGEKQPCPKCGKMYTEGELRKHLKRHKIREEGIKRKKYTCEYCGTEMNFTSRKRHLLKQHGIMLRGRGETAERVPISRADAM